VLSRKEIDRFVALLLANIYMLNEISKTAISLFEKIQKNQKTKISALK